MNRKFVLVSALLFFVAFTSVHAQKVTLPSGGNTQGGTQNPPPSGANGGGTVGNVINTLTGQGAGGNGLSNEQIINGLKEALTVSAQNTVGLTSKTDGFFKNPEIFIPFPKEAQSVKTLADRYGLKAQTDNFVQQLNRAAEDAAKSAAPIFVNAITSITITDGIQLLKGGDDAATRFLDSKTRKPLYDTFLPVVKTSLDKVKITQIWTPLWRNYNKYAPAAGAIGGMVGQGNALPKAVNPNLPDYVTKLALDGLFKMMAKEEAKIRKDPAAQVTNLLQTVFGNLGGGN
jgi:hypothetical protein